MFALTRRRLLPTKAVNGQSVASAAAARSTLADLSETGARWFPAVAIVCFDLIGCGFEAAEAIRRAIREHTGIEQALLNFAHPHSSRGLGCPGEHGGMSADEMAWHDATHRAILDVVAEAQALAAPAMLRAGRAPAQVGYNRRYHVPRRLGRYGATTRRGSSSRG